MTLDAIMATFVPSFVLRDPGSAVLVEIHRLPLYWSREESTSIRPANSTLVLIANSEGIAKSPVNGLRATLKHSRIPPVGRVNDPIDDGQVTDVLPWRLCERLFFVYLKPLFRQSTHGDRSFVHLPLRTELESYRCIFRVYVEEKVPFTNTIGTIC